jgi:hypothetical protein
VSRRRRGFFGSLVLSVGLLGAASVHYASARGAGVIEIEGPSDDAVVDRLAPELRSSGFVVIVVPEHGPPDATGDDVDAVLRVTPTRVEVWIIDGLLHTASVVDTVHVDPPHAANADVVAVRLAELLRARLLVRPPPRSPSLDASTEGSATPPQISSAPPLLPEAGPSPDAPAAPPPSVQPAPIAERTIPAPGSPSADANVVRPFEPARFGLDAGLFLLVSAQGVPPALELLLAPRWMPWSSLIVRAILVVPVLSPTVSSSQGSAAVTTWMAGARGDWRLTREEAPWTASLGAGVAAAWVGTKGDAKAPFISSSGDQVTAVPFLVAHGARALGSPHFRLGVDGVLGVALPEVEIQFAGQSVASWGRPVVGLAVLLEIDAPR